MADNGFNNSESRAVIFDKGQITNILDIGLYVKVIDHKEDIHQLDKRIDHQKMETDEKIHHEISDLERRLNKRMDEKFKENADNSKSNRALNISIISIIVSVIIGLAPILIKWMN